MNNEKKKQHNLKKRGLFPTSPTINLSQNMGVPKFPWDKVNSDYIVISKWVIK